jgi:long-chain acyl-CoA synthetase
MISEFCHRETTHPAIVDASSGREITYAELEDRTKATAAWLLGQNPSRDLTFLYASNTVDSILLYLAALDGRVPLCLLEPKEPNLKSLTEIYRPGLILVPRSVGAPCSYIQSAVCSDSDYVALVPAAPPGILEMPHPSLAILLQTSGTTGSPKLVRLTKSNILTNAGSIAEYLTLDPGETSIQGLPMHYSYGLSLINSHLLGGGTIVLTKHSFMMADFWKDFDRHKCTSFAGIPFMYETLHRLKFEPKNRPTLRTMTQAGGGLRPDLIQHFFDKARHAGVHFCVMYGQTEATARISYVPCERLGKKIGSIGIAIPRGRLTLEQLEGVDGVDELVYEGPNVMMGYAEDRSALALGDVLHGVLRTGDLARVDDDGFFYLTGRLKRFAKLFGRRINLADIEAHVEREFGVEAGAVEAKNKLGVFVAAPTEFDVKPIRRKVADFLSTGLMMIEVISIPSLPRTQAGKKDYKNLPSL